MLADVQESHFNKILHLIQIGHTQEAIKLGQEYIRSYPQDSEGYGILGKIHLQIGNHKEALYWAKEALTMDPNSFLGWQVKVTAYYDAKDWKNFDKVIAQALAVYPEEGFYFFLKANKLNTDGKLKQALEYFEKAAELESYNALFIAACSYTHALLRQREKSVDYEKQALQLEVENDAVFLYLGWAAQKRGEYDLAIEYVTNAVKLDPEDKQIRQEYLSMLQHKYKIYRILNLPAKLKRTHLLLIWIIGWILFKPLVVLFLILYALSHLGTKLLVHIKIFGWTFRKV